MLLHGFLSKLVVASPRPYAQTFLIFFFFFLVFILRFFFYFLRIFFVLVNMGPMGAQTSKCYSALKSLLKLFMNFLLSGPHKSTVNFWMFAILSFRFLTNFWISPLYPMGTPQTSIIWKTSDRRAKRSEIWVLGWVFSVYRVLLTLKWLRSFWGHWVHFRFSKKLYLENEWS